MIYCHAGGIFKQADFGGEKKPSKEDPKACLEVFRLMNTTSDYYGHPGRSRYPI